MSQFSPIFMNSIFHLKWHDQERYYKLGLKFVRLCINDLPNFLQNQLLQKTKLVYIKLAKEIGIVLYYAYYDLHIVKADKKQMRS